MSARYADIGNSSATVKARVQSTYLPFGKLFHLKGIFLISIGTFLYRMHDSGFQNKLSAK